MTAVLVVGAGLAGATVARRLAEAGLNPVVILERRDHPAGNCHDPWDAARQLRIHAYGPHIFHTRLPQVVSFLSRFTTWLPYRHRVEALVDGVGHVPLPINRTTLQRLFSVDLPDEAAMRAFLDRLRCRHPIPANARQAAENVYGSELTETFFGRYSRKMWGLPLEALPAGHLARLPVRYDDNPDYFDDPFQALPNGGYTAMVERMLDHPHIRLHLRTVWDPSQASAYDHVFSSAPLDTCFGQAHGPLPWRSLRFHQDTPATHHQPVPTVNYTDEGPFTRCTDWRLYPGGGRPDSRIVLTREQPCDWRENQEERFYPLLTADGAEQRLLAQYQALAAAQPGLSCIGRLGRYRYLNMDQTVAEALDAAEAWLQRRQ